MNVNQVGKSGSLSDMNRTTLLKLSQPTIYLYKLVLAIKNSFLN